MNSFPLHPDCPDLASRGPNLAEAALRVHAEEVQEDLKEQRAGWRKGFTRRRVLGAAGTVTVAALGTQYVDTKVSFGKTKNGITLLDIFLYGGLDGLHALVPNTAALGGDILRQARGGLALGAGQVTALPGGGGWAVNNAMAPLMPYWNSKELAFVPASGRAGTRSHFEEEDFFHVGGTPQQVRTGMWNRVLTNLGPGSTFRAMSRGNTVSRSLVGPVPALSMNNIGDYKFPGSQQLAPASKAAINALFRGVDPELNAQVANTMKSLAFAENLSKTDYVPANGVQYDGGFEEGLRDIARLMKGGAEVEVGTIGIGGFDTHSNQVGQLTRLLGELSTGLAKFMTDLGPAGRKKVTVMVRTEFGRRVGDNDGGTDHGKGGVTMLLGAGIQGGQVHGAWPGLADGALDDGNVAAVNHGFDIVGTVAQNVLGAGSMATVFPGHAFKPMAGLTRLTP